MGADHHARQCRVLRLTLAEDIADGILTYAEARRLHLRLDISPRLLALWAVTHARRAFARRSGELGQLFQVLLNTQLICIAHDLSCDWGDVTDHNARQYH